MSAGAPPPFAYGSLEDKKWMLESLFPSVAAGSANAHLLKQVLKVAKQLEPCRIEDGEAAIPAGDTTSEPRLVLFRTGTAETLAAVLSDGNPPESSSTRRSFTLANRKVKRIARLRGPFFVGESWLLNGATPKATVKAVGVCECYKLLKSNTTTLISESNSCMLLLARDLQATAFERSFVHDFCNSLFEHNLGDTELMSAFLAYGNEHFCVENFEFCLAVHNLKIQADEVKHFDEALSELVEPIWDTYVQPGDVLNISGKVKSKLRDKRKSAIDSRDFCDLCSIFDDATTAVHKSIQQGLTPAFMKSKHYDDFLKKRFPVPGVATGKGGTKSNVCLIS